jgi:hypothetical protein
MKEWHVKYKNCLWFTFLFSEDQLGWKEDFLEENRGSEKKYGEHINESILSAAKSMQSTSPGEQIAISQLLHTASSVVLLESHRRQVDSTLKYIQETDPFREMDPSIVLTSTALYYLTLSAEDRYKGDDENKKMIERVHSRLDQINWFLSNEGMQKLGILPLQKDIDSQKD